MKNRFTVSSNGRDGCTMVPFSRPKRKFRFIGDLSPQLPSVNGDLRPVKRLSRIAAIVIAFLGLLLTGILIALAVRAGTVALGSRGPGG